MRRVIGSLFSALLLFLFSFHPAVAQQRGTITGTVVDSETGQPLESAQVSIIGSQGLGGLTNTQGVYRVQVPSGTYSVAVEIIGYANARTDGVSVDAGETETVDFQLDSRATVLNPLVVTASRRREKALESPSTVVTIGKESIEERATTTPIDHVKTLPGVDVSQTGLTQSNVVTRGFNNVFSGALLVITDNRYASVPSLRFNAYNMIPTSQSDIERMEVLLGPAAALYGPNSASGVLHIITSSPLEDQGTTVSLSGGARSVFKGEFRTSQAFNENVGLRVSGNYFRGNDWEYIDPVEQQAAQQNPGNDLIAARNFDAEKFGGEARLDVRWGDDNELIFNAGLNNVASSVELTGIGAGQADDWRYTYAQTRFRSGRFFAQAFMNKSDAGDTYLLRTGQPIVDKSEMWVVQAQHGFSLADERQDFIYGVDAAFTRPKTEGTITGRNEDEDDINELGGYLQSQTQLSEQLEVIAALRIDDHNRLEDLNYSPRAALVFRPNENQNFRLTYNRSFSTPTTNNLFLDLVAARNPFGVGTDIRTLGVPEGGFTFSDRCGNTFCMVSPFAQQRLPAQALTAFWNPLIQGLAAQSPLFAQLAPALMNPGAAPGDPALASALLRFNQELQAAGEFPFVPDPEGPDAISPISSTIHNTFEIGYKGIIGGRLLFTADVYSENITDFVGPLRVETPTVHFSLPSVQAFVLNRLGPAIQAGQISQAQAQQIIGTLAAIPLGTVAPDGFDSSDILLTYRNFGDVDYWGADAAFQFLATDKLSFTGSYAYVSEECFDFDEDGECFSARDVALNAPQNKGAVGVRWEDKRAGIVMESRARFVEGFPMNSGVFIGDVPGYGVVDANVSYRLQSIPGASVTLTGYNILDNMHREFVGAPEMGRMLLLRLKYDF